MTLLRGSNKERIRRILREDLSEEERLLPPEVQDQLIEDRLAYEESVQPRDVVTDEEAGKVWDTTNPREPQEVSVKQTVSGLDLAAQDVFKKLYPEQPDAEAILKQAEVTPEAFLQDLDNRGTLQERELMLRAMGASDQDVQEIYPAWERQAKLETLTGKVFPKYTLEDLTEFMEQEPDEFVKTIKLGGMTPEKQELLKELGIPETEIDDMFMDQFVKTGAEWFKEFNPDRGEDIGAAGRPAAEKQGKAFIAGIGDMIAGAGGAARWLGFKDVGENLTRFGAGLQAQAPEYKAKEFELTDLLDPDYWDTQIPRQLPFALSMMPVAMVGYAAGGAVAAAVGLGRVGTMIFGGLTSAALTRPMESAVEAGQSYDDAISRGQTEAEARKQADEVFKNNMMLAGSDAFEIATALAPTPKWVPKSLVSSGLARVVRFAGKTLIVGLTEGGEEVYQDMVQRHARGEEWKLDPVTKEVFAMGAILGMGMGMGGDVVTDVVARAQEQMTGSLKSTFKQAVRQLVTEGFNRDEAELRALNVVAQEKEGETLLKKVITEVKEIYESEKGAVEILGEVPKEKLPITPETAEDILEGAVETQYKLSQSMSKRLETFAQKEGLDKETINEIKQAFRSGDMMKLEEYQTGEISDWVTDAIRDLEKQGQKLYQKVRVKGGVSTGEVTKVTEKVTPKEPWMMTREEYAISQFEKNRVSADQLFQQAQEKSSLANEITGGKGRRQNERLIDEAAKLKRKAIIIERKYIGGFEKQHQKTIKQALSEGKPVPPEVLKDYPDLAKSAKPSGVTPEIPKAETPKVEAPKQASTPSDVPIEPELAKTAKTEAKIPGTIGGEPPESYKTREEIANMSEEELARFEKSLGIEPPPPAEPPPQSISVPEPPAQPKEIDRVVDLATEDVRQHRADKVTKFFYSIPGIHQLMEFERPALAMTGKNEKVLVAMNAEKMAKSMIGTQALGTQIDLLKQLRKAFGKGALHGKKAENVTFIGTAEQAKNPITGTIKDIADNPELYELTPTQKGVLQYMDARNSNLLDVVVKDYGAEIGEFKAKEGGAFLPNVDVGEDVIEYLGSETRAVATGRGKTRVWATARERMGGKTKFTPELDVEKLIQGLDGFKASTAGGQAFRQVIGGLTRLEAMKETHPALYEKMDGLKKRLQSLRGTIKGLSAKQDVAVEDFLNSPLEGLDIANLQAELDPKVGRAVFKTKDGKWVTMKPGVNYGKDIQTLEGELDTVKTELSELRPMWEAANLKPYIFIQEGVYRYFPADTAKLIRETRLVSKNPILMFIERWRGGAFSGDISPFAIQGSVGVLADPWGSMKVGAGAVKSAVQHHDFLRSFTLDALADDIGNNITDWGEYAALMGRDLSGTPTEYAAGFLSKIPGFDKFTESTYITVTRQSFALWQRTYKDMIKAGVPEIAAKVAAADVVGKVYPLINPTRLGQSQARTAFLRALPTSYSFIRQPFSIIGQASSGFAKLVTLQKLTPKESYSVKFMVQMASSILLASATSAAISAMALGKDEDEIRKAIWDAINPNPYNGNFASIIIGDKRIPLGGPYRAIFRALYPAEVKGVPFPVPFAGIPRYIANRISPAIRTQFDLLLNKDYSGQSILKGDLPEKIVRGLLYEFESALPLTAGTVAERLRLGEKYKEDLAQQVIAQFMGVNMATMDNTYLDRQKRKLGLPKEISEGDPFSIQKSEVYLTKDFWGDVARTLSFREQETGKPEGYDDDPKVKAIIEARAIKDQMETMPNEKPVKINADVTKGDTFIEYFEQWQQRQKVLKDEMALAEFDKKYPKAYLGNMSQNTYVLLQKYHSMTDRKVQADFLKEHPELGLNPREEWLRSHPEDNARLAIWGQSKILTEAAYNKARSLVKELDIPEDALDKFLPPTDLAKPLFELQDTAEKWGSNSWEVKLQLAKNDDLRKYLEREAVDTPVKSLKIKIKNRDLFDKLDAFADKESPDYISDDKRREEAVKKFKKDNPAFVDDLRRIEAIEKGTDKVPTPDEVVNKHVQYGQMIDKDEIAASSAETMLFRVDNPDYEKWRTDEKLWEKQALKPVDMSQVPKWRIDVKYRKEDAEYEALPEAGRQKYLESHEAYRKDRRRREAYAKKITDVEGYVAYYELPTAGYRRERLLLQKPTLAQEMGLKVSDKVPSEQYDVIFDKGEAKWTPEDKLKMEAYKKFVPDTEVNNYVSYYKILKQGKGENGTDLWYDDDWFLMEHMDFYRNVYLGILKNERRDFRKVPSREVFQKYARYLRLLPGEVREDYRRENRDLDDWLVIKFNFKPITAKKQVATTPPKVSTIRESKVAADLQRARAIR